MPVDTRRFGHSMPFGAQVTGDGVRFRIWAPGCARMSVVLEEASAELPMRALDDGWHELVTGDARAGSRYRFVLPDGTPVPDPASRFQPEDVHGPSEVIDPRAYEWRAAGWRGRPWHEAVVYELHIGAFTPEGTFRAAIAKLDHIAALGATAIEIMPVAEFAGSRNWGYDGVLLYAPDCAYGCPEDLKALVDAAHERELMVLLDVVYNHFGPDGNYLTLYAPSFFTDRHETPWGAAIDYGSIPVRQFAIQNALYWLEEYRFDGLRLDAVHAIIDDSEKHVLTELSETLRATIRDRHIHLVLENEHNEPKRLARAASCDPRWFTAQWNDDVHHVLHVAATGEGNGYYEEYHGDTEKLGRALAEGFAFQGEVMRFSGRARGAPCADLPPAAFIAFIQNHDQIGNRACGERIGTLAPAEAVRAVAACYLLLPQVPMMFMGEEWNAAQPFVFFCDFSGELARAVSEGRRNEFAAFPEFQDPQKRAAIPDPQSPEAFASSKLDWSDVSESRHAEWLEWYRRVLRTRKQEIVPRIEGLRNGGTYTQFGDGAVRVSWRSPDGESLVLEANLSSLTIRRDALEGAREIWREGAADAATLGAWSVTWSIVR